MPKLSLLTAALTFTDTLSAPAWVPRVHPFQTRFEDLRRGLRDHVQKRQVSRLEKSWHDSLSSGQPLTFGHLDQPLDLAAIPSLLSRLMSAPAGAVRFICSGRSEPGSSTAPLDLSTFREADQHHAIQIELVPSVEELTSPGLTAPGPTLDRLRELTSSGIATRLAIPYSPGASDQDFHLHRIFETALRHGAFDLFPIVESPKGPSAAPQSWVLAFRRLRLEYDCPRAFAGRA